MRRMNRNGEKNSFIEFERWRGKYAVLYSFLIAAITMTFCSRSSFLAPMNNWDDANSYFSMGKALFNGKVIYRDVLDQKGPMLYFIYGIAYLISNQNFLGVYFIEIIMAGIFLYGCFKIMNLYMESKLSGLFLPLLSAVIYSSVSFWWGGSAEELCLPFFVWPLYFMLKYFRENSGNTIGRKEIAITGLCAGMVALIKFNSLGFFAAWMLVVVLIDFVAKEWKRLFGDCFWFLGWMLLLFVPWVIYFAINDALFFWYQGYIHYNVFIYADFSDETLTLGIRIYKLAKILYWLIIEHIQYFFFIILGVGTVILHPKRKWMEKFAIAALCFFLFLGIYIGGVELKYYSMPLTVFAVLGFCSIGNFAEWLADKWGSKKQKGSRKEEEKQGERERKRVSAVRELKLAWMLGIVMSIAVSGVIMTQLSLNTDYRKTKKEDLYLYKLSSAMEVEEDTTLLNISCFDIGLYTVTGIIPNCYWFQTQTLPIEDVLIDQSQYIREQKVDYIVAREYYPQVVEEGYELIATQKEEERDFTYYLFRKKGL